MLKHGSAHEAGLLSLRDTDAGASVYPEVATHARPERFSPQIFAFLAGRWTNHVRRR